MDLSQKSIDAETECSSAPEKSLIESTKFPFSKVSESSAVEKGPGRPPHWEMVFWWMRKPLIFTRAVIAGCMFREDNREFLRQIGMTKKTAHSVQLSYR